LAKLSRYAYLDTRISLMASRLVSGAEFLQFADEKGDIHAHAVHLAQRLGISDLGLHETLDHRVMPLLLEELSILLRPLTGAARELLLYWARRFEISNLKALLRGKMNNEPNERVRQQLIPVGPFASLPNERLLMSADIAELLRNVEETPYAEVARDARRIFEKEQELFAIDAGIDRRYYAGLMRRVNSDGLDGRANFQRLIGWLIDRINLVWLLRYRFTYGLSPSQSYYLLIPAGYRLTGPQLLTLAQYGNLEEVLDHLPEPFHSLLEGAQTTSEVMRRLELKVWEQGQSILRHGTGDPSRALAYLILRERDLRRARAILRGRRLNMSQSLIKAAAGLGPIETDALTQRWSSDFTREAG
jgi:V/A-type H+-transporting ATPase subunit C